MADDTQRPEQDQERIEDLEAPDPDAEAIKGGFQREYDVPGGEIGKEEY